MLFYLILDLLPVKRVTSFVFLGYIVHTQFAGNGDGLQAKPPSGRRHAPPVGVPHTCARYIQDEVTSNNYEKLFLNFFY